MGQDILWHTSTWKEDKQVLPYARLSLQTWLMLLLLTLCQFDQQTDKLKHLIRYQAWQSGVSAPQFVEKTRICWWLNVKSNVMSQICKVSLKDSSGSLCQYLANCRLVPFFAPCFPQKSSFLVPVCTALSKTICKKCKAALWLKTTYNTNNILTTYFQHQHTAATVCE